MSESQKKNQCRIWWLSSNYSSLDTVKSSDVLFTSWHSVLLYPYVCSSLLEVLWSGICSTVHTSYSTFLTNPRFVIIPSQRFAQPPLLFLSLNFQQFSTEKNQFAFVIPCLASHMSRNKSEIICSPAAKIWPPPSSLSLALSAKYQKAGSAMETTSQDL